jgi:hypothetical protein
VQKLFHPDRLRETPHNGGKPAAADTQESASAAEDDKKFKVRLN